MNSFTKPPVAGTRKYQFDTDFDAEEERRRFDAAHSSDLVEELVLPVSPMAQFSEDDLTQARSEAFQAGFENGLNQATTSIENTLTSAIDTLMEDVKLLLSGEEKRLKACQETALRTTIAAIKKIWPQILKKMGQETIEATLRQSMEYNPEESRIVVRVHDTMLDAVVQRLPQIQQQQAFAGKVIIIADAGIQAGDCRIEWADGGLERLSRTLSANIDDALDRILANLPNQSQTEPDRISS